MRRPALPRGFTLIEVLIGALILGIFVSFVYGTVVSAFQVRSIVQSTTSALASGSMAVEVVARDLENAFWRPMEGTDCFKAEQEGGSLARISFLTTTDSRTQAEIERVLVRSDVTEVGYRTRQGEGGLNLYRREQFGVDDKPLEGGDWYKVAGGVREFRIEWFEEDSSREGADEDAEALPDWDSKEKKRLPRAARVVLVLEGASTDPSRPGDVMTFHFTRWVLLPGAEDKDPKPAEGGTNTPGGNNNPGGSNNPGGN